MLFPYMAKEQCQTKAHMNGGWKWRESQDALREKYAKDEGCYRYLHPYFKICYCLPDIVGYFYY